MKNSNNNEYFSPKAALKKRLLLLLNDQKHRHRQKTLGQLFSILLNAFVCLMILSSGSIATSLEHDQQVHSNLFPQREIPTSQNSFPIRDEIKKFLNMLPVPISPDGVSLYSRFIALGLPGSKSFFINRQGKVNLPKD